MNSFLISIFAVGILSFIIKILLPPGNTNKVVLLILSCAMVLMVAMPLQNLITGDKNTILLQGFDIQLDEKYISFSNECRSNYYLSLAKIHLSSNGIQLKDAEFVFEQKDDKSILKKIIIKKTDLVIKENQAHINISYEVQNALAKLFSITCGDVLIYE